MKLEIEGVHYHIEILNEDNKLEVMNDISDWLLDRLNKVDNR